MLRDGEFAFRGDTLACESVSLAGIADAHGTPAYVYSKRAMVSRFHEYQDALADIPHRICFSVKANSNLTVLRTLAREGAGFDIVSGGELYRVLTAGGDPGSVVFSGVAKTESEIRFALEKGIHSFNCESESELDLISHVAMSLQGTASIALRVNPNVDPLTHPYISTGLRQHKFGIEIENAEALYRRAAQLPGLLCEGVSCHIGSQMLELDPLLAAAQKAFELVRRLRDQGLPIRTLDLGGGLGVPYRPTERAVTIAPLVDAIRGRLKDLELTLMLEPGRSIIAEAGVLLTRVQLVKHNRDKTFVIVDAAMNDLIRPALYQAYHEILPVLRVDGLEQIEADVVGPVCETADCFAQARELPAVKAGDLLAICTVGAYGFVSASNYNSRPRACELLVDRDRVQVARKRERYDDLIRGELPESAAEPVIVHTDLNDERLACDFCSEPS